jgi:hypothetical protein
LDDTLANVTDIAKLAGIEFAGRRQYRKKRGDTVSSPDDIDFTDGASDFKALKDVLVDEGVLEQALLLIHRDASTVGQEWKATTKTTDMEVCSYTRCVVSGEEFTSLAYTTAYATASYHVALRSSLRTTRIADVTCEKYASVSRYYHVRMISGHASVANLALVKLYHVDDDLSSDAMGTKVLKVAPSSTLQIVHMADILTKCIIHHCAVDNLTYAVDLYRRLSIARD